MAITRKPEWLKVRIQNTKNLVTVGNMLKENKLNTVCHGANCPNRLECFSKKTATFMILGSNCTRHCTFCNISAGVPEFLDLDEPRRVAEAIKTLGLKHTVITSVTRDDLLDGGAGHFAHTVNEIKRLSPETVVEVLIPDFRGDLMALQMVMDSKPDIINHNVETVETLYNRVRPEADYHQSLSLLKMVKTKSTLYTKSGFMLGLGEEDAEVYRLIDDLASHEVDFLTIGQYLQPSEKHYPMVAYVTPEKFELFGDYARSKGFKFVASSPLVRSSYNASEFYEKALMDPK